MEDENNLRTELIRLYRLERDIISTQTDFIVMLREVITMINKKESELSQLRQLSEKQVSKEQHNDHQENNEINKYQESEN